MSRSAMIIASVCLGMVFWGGATSQGGQTIVLSTDEITVPEFGVATFTVHLAADPLGSVTVTVAPQSGDPDIHVRAGDTLLFNSGNFSTPQTVELGAYDDPDFLNGTAEVCASAPGYQTECLTATEADNDSPPSIQFSEVSLTIPEGGSASFDVTLSGDPIIPITVTVAVDSGDPDISVLSGGSLDFDSSNFSIPQTVELAAAEDPDFVQGEAEVCASSPPLLPDCLSAHEVENDFVIFVDHEATGANNGSSWIDAFTDLQVALSTPGDIDAIWVAEGTYKPTDTADREVTFFMPSNTLVYGGFQGVTPPPPGLPFGETDVSQRDFNANETILSGDLNGDDGPDFVNYSDNSYTVATLNDKDSVLDGFVITGGNADGSGSPGATKGGGVYLDNTGAPIDDGGTVTNCKIVRNQAIVGGGVYIDRVGTVTHCFIAKNHALYDGGGIKNFSPNAPPTDPPVVSDCAIVANTSDSAGGGVSCGGDQILIVNCTFNGNVADSGCALSAPDVVANCIIWGNQEPQLSGISGDYNYCIIEGGESGPGIIDADPLFVDPDGPDDIPGNLDDDLRVRLDSPAVNAGSNSYVISTTDFDGNPRVQDGVVDIGAFEGGVQAFLFDTDPVVVTEGGVGVFTVRLAGDPLGTLDALVEVSGGDFDITVQSGANLSFDSNNFSVPQPVTLAAAEDSDYGDGTAQVCVSAVATYTTCLDATENDNDGPPPAIVVDTQSVGVPEGGTASFNVHLDSAPLFPIDVSATITTGDPDISVLSGSVLTFGPGDFSIPQQVMLAAQADADIGAGTAIVDVTAPGLVTVPVTATEIEDPPIPDVLYVDDDAAPGGDGSDWNNAFNHLQDAISPFGGWPAGTPVEVCAAQGFYHPDEGAAQTQGDQTATFQLVENVTIKGGFAGVGAPDPNERDISGYETTLSGNIAGNNIERVVTGSGVGSGAVLDGATVEGGAQAGIYNDNASPSIVDCTMTANDIGVDNRNSAGPSMLRCSIEANGRGVYNEDSSPTLTDCEIRNNVINVGFLQLGQGAGMLNSGSSQPMLIGCLFEANSVTGFNMSSCHGGAMASVSGAQPTAVGCVFKSNLTHAEDYESEFFDLRSIGGAVDGGGEFRSCLFDNNATETAGWADARGGAADGGNFVNCTFVKNYSGTGEAVYGGQLLNCIAWNNGSGFPSEVQVTTFSDVTYSNIEGGFEGEGNISADPLFVDEAGGDYRLSVGSPSIDAGDKSNVPQPGETDLDGNPRLMGCFVDMGSYEFIQPTPVPHSGDLDLSGFVDLSDLPLFVEDVLNAVDGDGCAAADMNSDGFVNGGDIRLFLVALLP